MNNITITGKRLCIKPPVEVGKTQTGIHLPDGYVSEFNPWQGEIVGVGTEANGAISPGLYHEGQIVMIIPGQAIALELEGIIYLMIPTDSVLAIVPELQKMVHQKVAESRTAGKVQLPNGRG